MSLLFRRFKTTLNTNCLTTFYSKKIYQILSLDIDDFDKLIILEQWFMGFSTIQKKNIIKNFKEWAKRQN